MTQVLRAAKLKTDFRGLNNLSLRTASRSLKSPWLVAAKKRQTIL